MKIILLLVACFMMSIQLSLMYAETAVNPPSNFTYNEILADRISQPLPGNYEAILTETSDSQADYFIKRYTDKSGLLRFVLFQDGSFSRNTYNFCMTNLTGDVVFMNFGKYANISVNLKNALMTSQYLQICIPYGNWYHEPTQNKAKK